MNWFPMQSALKARPTLQNKFSSHKPSRNACHEVIKTATDSSSGELVLIRGLPGSGKSTMARDLVSKGFHHFEADMYFEVDGEYQYDASRIRDAHNWCQKMARQSLAAGNRVVVSNTFTQLREMEPYRAMTGNLRVVEAKGTWHNLHGVPPAMMERMAERWEALQ